MAQPLPRHRDMIQEQTQDIWFTVQVLLELSEPWFSHLPSRDSEISSAGLTEQGSKSSKHFI